MTIYYRNRSIIKGGTYYNIVINFIFKFLLIIINIYFKGGIEFLIIILVGIIVNSFNIILLTFNKTTNLCYLIYLIENTVIKTL